jgi:AbrB family looped-hinge helix DNA binding protein
MVVKVSLDKAGRIVLPKPLRDELRLTAGDALEAEASGEEITLRPIRGNAPLRKKRGIWVYRAGEPLRDTAVRETLRQVGRERDADNLGKSH